MPDPTDKRVALIEALGHAICISDLKERIAATVDAIVAIVDARLAAYLRAPEAEGGGTDCGTSHAPSEEGEGPARCPLERITVYWCDSALGIHYDGSSGLWNGERKRPEEYVRADKLAAAERRIAELESSRDAEIDRRIAEYTAEHDRQCRATQERIAELEAERDDLQIRLRRSDRDTAEAREQRDVAQREFAEARTRYEALANERNAAVKRAEEAERSRAEAFASWEAAETAWRERVVTRDRDLEQARAALDEVRGLAIDLAYALRIAANSEFPKERRAALDRWEAHVLREAASPAHLDADREEERAKPAWCQAHQHRKWCEHNGGVMGPSGYEAPATAATNPTPNSETAWLIEDDKIPLCYSQDGSSCRRWVTFTDPAAWRFTTKEEADAIIRERGLTGAIATEHGWSPAPSAADEEKPTCVRGTRGCTVDTHDNSPCNADEEKPKCWGIWSRTRNGSTWTRVAADETFTEETAKRRAAAWSDIARGHYVYEPRLLPADAEAEKETTK